MAGWLPRRLPWPEPSETLWAKLPRVVTDPGLLRAIGRVLQRYEEATGATAPGDRVLVHGDLGLHNIALVPGTDEVAGVFDYGDAASVTEQSALDAAAGFGLDMARLRRDMADPAIAAAIARNQALAAELGINGTPGFVIGQEIVPGAVDRATLDGLIAKARETRRAQP